MVSIYITYSYKLHHIGWVDKYEFGAEYISLSLIFKL